ncbi:hypothetical protein AMECASPLE_035410, partial [Ameca splendens]
SSTSGEPKSSTVNSVWVTGPWAVGLRTVDQREDLLRCEGRRLVVLITPTAGKIQERAT